MKTEKIGLLKQIKEDFFFPYHKEDPALTSRWEILFNYPGVWSIINYRIANKVYNNGFHLLGRAIMGFNTIFASIDIHPSAQIGRRVFIDHGIGVVIGETAIIGDDVLIYQGVTLGGVNLDRIKRHPTIEKNVVIGAGAKILGDITIGENSKIGANSVVVNDIPKNTTAVGIPAKIFNKKNHQRTLDHNNIPDVYKQILQDLEDRIKVLENKKI
jgi:serine O-acetyltransferase